MRIMGAVMMIVAIASTRVAAETEVPATLKAHGIFSSDMVLQRGKPINIWGWAEPGHEVKVRFGNQAAKAVATAEEGRWTEARPAKWGRRPPNAGPIDGEKKPNVPCRFLSGSRRLAATHNPRDRMVALLEGSGTDNYRGVRRTGHGMMGARILLRGALDKLALAMLSYPDLILQDYASEAQNLD